jgi:hypothetical protein
MPTAKAVKCRLLTFTNFKGNDWYVFVYTAREFEGQLNGDAAEGGLAWVRGLHGGVLLSLLQIPQD